MPHRRPKDPCPSLRQTDTQTDHGKVSSNTPHRNANAYMIRRNKGLIFANLYPKGTLTALDR